MHSKQLVLGFVAVRASDATFVSCGPCLIISDVGDRYCRPRTAFRRIRAGWPRASLNTLSYLAKIIGAT